MAKKKKFEKPKMEVIKMNAKVSIMAGSCPGNTALCADCSTYGGLGGCDTDGCGLNWP